MPNVIKYKNQKFECNGRTGQSHRPYHLRKTSESMSDSDNSQIFRALFARGKKIYSFCLWPVATQQIAITKEGRYGKPFSHLRNESKNVSKARNGSKHLKVFMTSHLLPLLNVRLFYAFSMVLRESLPTISS